MPSKNDPSRYGDEMEFDLISSEESELSELSDRSLSTDGDNSSSTSSELSDRSDSSSSSQLSSRSSESTDSAFTDPSDSEVSELSELSSPSGHSSLSSESSELSELSETSESSESSESSQSVVSDNSSSSSSSFFIPPYISETSEPSELSNQSESTDLSETSQSSLSSTSSQSEVSEISQQSGLPSEQSGSEDQPRIVWNDEEQTPVTGAASIVLPGHYIELTIAGVETPTDITWSTPIHSFKEYDYTNNTTQLCYLDENDLSNLVIGFHWTDPGNKTVKVTFSAGGITMNLSAEFTIQAVVVNFDPATNPPQFGTVGF